MRPLPGAPPEDLGDGVVTLRLRRESDAPQITRGAATRRRGGGSGMPEPSTPPRRPPSRGLGCSGAPARAPRS